MIANLNLSGIGYADLRGRSVGNQLPTFQRYSDLRSCLSLEALLQYIRHRDLRPIAALTAKEPLNRRSSPVSLATRRFLLAA